MLIRGEMLGVLVMGLFILGVQSCATRYPAGGPYYFGSRVENVAPIEPTRPLRREEAVTTPGYGEALFDSNGRITKYQWMENGAVEWMATYSYGENSSIEETICRGGKYIVTQYDRRGAVSQSTVKANCLPGRRADLRELRYPLVRLHQ